MKQITISIPDNKEQLFIDLMKSLSFVKKIEPVESIDIPEWHKATLDQRIENYKNNPESYKEWKDVKKEIDAKYGL